MIFKKIKKEEVTVKRLVIPDPLRVFSQKKLKESQSWIE